MQLKKFEIENYRSLKKVSISEFDQTTIFYGTNNAGKSNILNALELIFRRKQKLNEGNLTEVENFYQGDIPDSKNNFHNNETESPIIFKIDIEVEYSELQLSPEIFNLFTKNENYTFSFEGKISFIEGVGDYSEFKVEQIKVGKSIIYSNKKSVDFFPSLKPAAKEIPLFSQAFIQLINIFNDCIYVLSSDRDMHEALIKDDNTPLLSPKMFKNYLYSLYLSRQEFHLFEEINDVFSVPPFSYGTISFSKEADGKLQLMVKEGGFRLPIKHLGSGVLQSLYIITAIICSKSKIVCIEELEQNLSPHNQDKILKKIKSMILDRSKSLNQLIISSHSSVYAKPSLGTIYFLEKEGGRTAIKKFIKKTIKSAAKKKGANDTLLGKELTEHLAPTTPGWTDEDIDKRYQEFHDFPPLPRAKKN